MKLTGIVNKKKISIGSKSEREVLVITDKCFDFILRRFGSNAVMLDEELLDLEGQNVTLEGAPYNNIFIFKGII